MSMACLSLLQNSTKSLLSIGSLSRNLKTLKPTGGSRRRWVPYPQESILSLRTKTMLLMQIISMLKVAINSVSTLLTHPYPKFSHLIHSFKMLPSAKSRWKVLLQLARNHYMNRQKVHCLPIGPGLFSWVAYCGNLHPKTELVWPRSVESTLGRKSSTS